jgi:hypothetical protein
VGSKNKLKRFGENETFENVFQPTREEVVSENFVFDILSYLFLAVPGGNDPPPQQ